MTSVASVLALLPIVIGGSIPGYEVEYPMAVVILGGLVTSTMLSLFITPIMYLRFGSTDSGKAIKGVSAQGAPK
jgi:Cu/Ag efflux pump CusA